MASNEGQGIQVALIIFVILTVILSISTFLLFRSYDSAWQERKNAVEQSAKDSKIADDLQDENNELKLWMGFPDDAKQPSIKTGYDADMQEYAATYPNVQQSYRQILAYLNDTTLTSLQNDKAALQGDITRLQAENTQREETRQLQIKQHSDAAAAAEASLQQQQAAFQTVVAQLEKTKGQLEAALNAERRKVDQITADTTKQIADLNLLIQRLENNIDSLRATIAEMDNESFEVADGRVVRVDVGSGTVWIDLGRADGLRRSVTFSVHDQDANTLEGLGRKGSIEVTRIVGEHLAEARILPDELTDPIVRNDSIYSPLWHPGRAVHYAFAGVVDMDGDGKSDRQTIHDLVRMNGAVIDAEVTDAGVRTGQLSLATGYLVLGSQPEVGKQENAGAAFEGYSQIQKEAGRIGTKIISFEQFLDRIGWKDSQRVLHFGKVADPADFVPPTPDGGRRNAPGSTSDLFRRRIPIDMGGRRPSPPSRARKDELAPM